MEQLAREVGTAAVDAVARDRMPQMFQMDANLVRAPGFGAALEQAEFSVRGDHFPRGFRGTCAGPSGDGHALPVHRVPRDGAADDSGRCARLPAHHGQVGFLRRPFGKLPRQCGVGGIVLGHQNAAARVLVQTVHDTWPERMASGRKARGMVHHRVDQRALPMAGRGMHHQSGGLVQANQIFVLVNDFQRDLLGSRRSGCLVGRRFRGADFVAEAHGLRGARALAVDFDQSQGERFLPTRAAHVGPRDRQPAVEPRSRSIGGRVSGGLVHGRETGEVCRAAQGLPRRELSR